MTATANPTLDSHDAAMGKLGPHAALEGPNGTLPLGSNGYPQPPAPPPPPKRIRTMERLTGLSDRIPARIRLAAGAVLVIASTVTFTRMFVHPVDESAIARNATDSALSQVAGYIDERLASKTQIAVSTPFSWAKCPLSNEAKVMIGGDPATGGKTINPERAAPLDTQAATLLQSFRMVDLRLVAVSQSRMQVVADQPTAGVALFNCNTDAAEVAPPAPTTAVAVPTDPIPPTTVAG